MNHVTIDRRAPLLGLAAAGLPAAACAQIAPGLPADDVRRLLVAHGAVDG